MYNLPKNRDNDSWAKINKQFFKGGFDWYNQRNPHCKRWYYEYYINESEKRSCLNISRYRRRNKVTSWLCNIEKFEKIEEKYENEDWERERRERKKENSMSWRRTKYEE